VGEANQQGGRISPLLLKDIEVILSCNDYLWIWTDPYGQDMDRVCR
jgi:hypothetical protein